MPESWLRTTNPVGVDTILPYFSYQKPTLVSFLSPNIRRFCYDLPPPGFTGCLGVIVFDLLKPAVAGFFLSMRIGLGVTIPLLSLAILSVLFNFA